MTTLPIPRLPNPLTLETIEGLMKARPYWDTSHPQSEIYRHIVRRGFEIMYPGPTRHDAIGKMIVPKPLKPQYITHLVDAPNREMEEIEREFLEQEGAGGAVHVQSHTRAGGKVEVADYWRSRSGEGTDSESTPESPKARNLLDDAEGAVNEDEAENAQAGTDDDRPTSRSPVPNPVMRNDGEGSGEFGAKRLGGRKHQGIDILVNSGDEVVSPVDGTIDKIAPAYSDPKYEGLQAVTITGDDGLEYKFLYVAPTDAEGNPLIKKDDRVSAGDPIGSAQNRGAYEPNGKMKDHIHIEIRDESKEIVDPTPHFERWRNESDRSDSSNETNDQSSPSGSH